MKQNVIFVFDMEFEGDNEAEIEMFKKVVTNQLENTYNCTVGMKEGEFYEEGENGRKYIYNI